MEQMMKQHKWERREKKQRKNKAVMIVHSKQLLFEEESENRGLSKAQQAAVNKVSKKVKFKKGNKKDKQKHYD